MHGEKAMVEILFHLASKWLKWCAQTLYPFSQDFENFLGHSGTNRSVT